MFARILVPLDGSVFAEQALPLALSLVRHAGCPRRSLSLTCGLTTESAQPSVNQPMVAWHISARRSSSAHPWAAGWPCC